MKAFFNELFQINDHFNKQLISILTENQAKASEKSIGLLSHMLNVHQIWNYKVQPQPVPYGAWQTHPIQDLIEINEQNFELSLFILDKFDLSEVVQYSNSKGQIFNNKIQEILFQIINHSTYHRGQIATEFRVCGLEPILTDYIYYKWTNPN